MKSHGFPAILIAGGIGDTILTGGYVPPLSSAEIYNEQTQNFAATGSMREGQVGHTATLLNNGEILVAGGGSGTETGTTVASAELYDPQTGAFNQTGSMTVARVGHTATLLPNGLVLMAGGGNATAILSTAELYDPTTGTFSITGSMTTARQYATATLLGNGQVLIAGGGTWTDTCSGCSVASAEIYDPASGTFTPVGNMEYSRRGHIAILLGVGAHLKT